MSLPFLISDEYNLMLIISKNGQVLIKVGTKHHSGGAPGLAGGAFSTIIHILSMHFIIM